MQFPPGIAIMSAHVAYSEERPIAAGQEARRLDMIGSRGFQIVETPRASSGSARVRLPLRGENHSPSVNEARRWPRITRPQRERAPPEPTPH